MKIQVTNPTAQKFTLTVLDETTPDELTQRALPVMEPGDVVSITNDVFTGLFDDDFRAVITCEMVKTGTVQLQHEQGEPIIIWN